jgi:cation diffusion facilitator family transporter
VSIRDLYRQSRRAAVWGIAVNLGLGLVKLAGGLLGHSVALLSDAVHSLGDALTSTVVFAALLWSQQPADREHPYGHSRAESIASFSVALLLVFSALWIAWEAITTLREVSLEPESFTLWIAGASILIKEGLFRYKSRVAGQTGSSAIKVAAWDHRLDALSSLAVFVGVALAKWGGPAYHTADHVAALMVALVILWAGSYLGWNSLNELMDRQAAPEVLQQVRREALAVPGVLGVEKLLIRKTGLEYLVDIHVEVDPEITVREGHAIGHAVKDRLLERMVRIKDVLVHIEPAPNKPAAVSRRA